MRCSAFTDGRGVDVVFENVGDPRLWPKAIESMATGGRLLTVGTHAGDGILPVDVRLLYRNRLTIMGGLRSGGQPDAFYGAAIQASPRALPRPDRPRPPARTGR